MIKHVERLSPLNYRSGPAADGHRFVLMFNLNFNQQLEG
jgi:hypothetical protein